MHRRRHQLDWTQGPAVWAPILLLTLLAFIGSRSAARTSGSGASATATPVISTRINVNTATGAQLELLPRIGPRLAQRIIDDRDANGPFEDAGDIQRVKGIGPKTAQRIAAVADFSTQR